MQHKQQQRQSQHLSPQDYSPEYSSPFSTHSMLQARFNQVTPSPTYGKRITPRDAPQFGLACKENFVEKPLAVYRDKPAGIRSARGDFKISQVTVDQSDMQQRNLLSETSDGVLIKQLKLDVTEKSSNPARSSINTQDVASYRNSDLSNSTQPLRERTNKGFKSTVRSAILKQFCVSIPRQKSSSGTSPLNGRRSKKCSPGFSAPSHQRKNKAVKNSIKRRESKLESTRNRGNNPETLEKLDQIPVPHPYPNAQSLYTEMTDNFTCLSEQVMLGSPETQKLDVQMMAKPEAKFMASAIQEQPTEEALSNFNSRQPSVQHQSIQSIAVTDPQIIQASASQEVSQSAIEPVATNQTGEAAAESLEQIRMLNQAIQKKFPSNYSPDKSPTDMSSLHDFSGTKNFEADVFLGAPNDQQDYYLRAEQLEEFENNFRPYANQGSEEEASMQAFKDSMSTCQNVRQQAMSHFITNIMQPKDQSFSSASGIYKGDTSTQLNEKSHRSDNVNHQKQYFCAESQQKKQQKRPGSSRLSIGKSPFKQQQRAVYGQCQVTSIELYKPVLRNSSSKLTQRSEVNKLSASVQGLPTRVDFLASSGPVDRLTTPLKPNFVSPVTGAPPRSIRCDSRASARRNLGTELSMSPIRKTISPKPKPKSLEATRIGTLSQLNNQQQNNVVRVALSGSKSPVRPQSYSRNVAMSAVSKSHNPPIEPSKQTNTILTNSRAVRHSVQASWASGLAQGLANKPYVASRSAPGTAQQKSTSVDPPHATKQPQNQTPEIQYKASSYQLRRAADAMKNLEIQNFLELERIKKPSAAVLAIARMTCIFFEVLRNRDDPSFMDQVESMHSWQQIQKYARNQLTCCVPELRTLLKKKIVSLGRVGDEEKPREVEIEQQLEKIWEAFFNESKIRVVKRFIQTSKLLRSLVYLIYAFLCLALNMEREFNLSNRLGLTEQPTIRLEELKFLITNSAQQTATAPIAETSPHLYMQRERSIEVNQNMSSIEQTKNTNSNQSGCSCKMHVQQMVSAINRSKSPNQNKSVDITEERKAACHNLHIANTKSFAQKIQERRSNVSRKSEKSPSLAVKDSYNSRNTNRPLSRKSIKSPMLMATIDSQAENMRTLDSVKVEEPSHKRTSSFESKQKMNHTNNSRQQQEKKQSKLVSEGVTISPQQLTIENYTSVQMPSSSKNTVKKIRKASTDDLDVILVSEDFRQPLKLQPQQVVELSQEESSLLPFKTERVFSPNSQTSDKEEDDPVAVTCRQQQYLKQKAEAAANALIKNAMKKTQDQVQVRRKRQKSSTFSSATGSDLANIVVRGNIGTSQISKSNNKTSSIKTRSKMHSATSSITLNSKTTGTGPTTSQRIAHSSKPSMSQSKTAHRKTYSISPITPTRCKQRPVQKSTNFSVSQKRIPTITVSQQPNQQHQVRHSRVSTLYKSTASYKAKLNANAEPGPQSQSHTTSKSPIRRPDSRQTTNTAPQKKMVTGGIKQHLASGQQKSVLQNSRRAKTPNECHEHASTNMLKKYQQVKRVRHTASAAQQVAAVERQKVIQKSNLHQEMLPLEEIDQMPSFGNSMDLLAREDWQRCAPEVTSNVMTVSITPQLQQVSSFQPEKQQRRPFEAEKEEDDLQTPRMPQDDLNNDMIRITPYVNKVSTARLGKQSSVQRSLKDSETETFEEPSIAIDCHQIENKQRKSYILQKAQAITENINSCYKQQKNMTQVDMATIEKLKKNRMKFVQQAKKRVPSVENVEPKQTPIPDKRRRHDAAIVQESCNIFQTEEDEAADYHEEASVGSVSDTIKTSFSDALAKLKSDVESLMQSRMLKQKNH